MTGTQSAASWEHHIGFYKHVISDHEPEASDNEEIRKWKETTRANAEAMIRLIYELRNITGFSLLSVRRSFHALTLHQLGTDLILYIGSENPDKGIYWIAAYDSEGEFLPSFPQQLDKRDLVARLRELFRAILSSDLGDK